MNRLQGWWKKNQRGTILLRACLAACLPVLCCLVYCAAQGKGLGQVYLPASEWNDELFYYKQVEGIVGFGYPQGYFGFNESHALKLSFAAWSPVLVWPWVLWGRIFGWKLLSPVICNIILLSLAVFAFMLLTHPTWKQLGMFALLFCLYTPFVRYMLSGMPEVICFSMLILFYGLAYRYMERKRGVTLAFLFVIASVMTLMRPYMLLFLLLPVYLWIRRRPLWGAIGSAAVLGTVLGGYGLIKHYLGAEYFTDLFFTDWITTFFREGIGAGIHHLFARLYYMGRDFISYTIEGFRSGMAAGAFFGAYLIMLLILAVQTARDYRKVRKGQTKLLGELTVEAHLALCFVGMLMALLLMYKLTEGSKHLLTFMAVGIFVISRMETLFFRKTVLMAAVFAYLFTAKAVDPYDYQVPFVTEAAAGQAAYWQQVYAQGAMALQTQQAPSYDNVVIWVFGDELESGYVNTKWQLLYGLPKGFGISCCMPEYCVEHFEELHSRYLAVVCGGVLDTMCMEAGYPQLGRDEDMVLYQRY